MKANVEDLYDSFKIGYEAFEASRKEANEVWDLYHNRQYTVEQLSVLQNRGQPAETFNVVKLFTRMMLGYYSSVVNTVNVTPNTMDDVDTASMLSDIVDHVFKDNRFDIEGDQIKLGGLISGLLCTQTDVVRTKKTDQFGQPVNRVVIHHVPDSELVLDPMSMLDDYSDAQYLHRFKWMTEATVKKMFGEAKMKKLDSYYNHLNVDEADFEFNYGWEFSGSYRIFDNYLIVHSVVEEDDGKRYSCFWSDKHMLIKKEITTRETRWPYRIQKLQSSNVSEYYGVFREVIEAQKAINQALIKLQLMINSEKAFVEEEAVENIDDFTQAFNRVSGVIKVVSLKGIKIERLDREVLDQYTIIDKGFDRIQRVLGINDSFLGMAFASDSGRKVKLQQNASIMSLRYLTARIEAFYQSLGWDIANLVKQFYTAHQVIRVSDEVVGQRWVEINKPMMEQLGNGEEQPILLPTMGEDGFYESDGDGNIILSPVNEPGSEFHFTEFDVSIESSAYNDEDEKAQLMLETVMSGQIGQMMAQVDPAGFFQMASLSIKSMKTKYSPNISELLAQTAQKLSQDPAAEQGASEMAQGGSSLGGQQPLSNNMSLPQNTNGEPM